LVSFGFSSFLVFLVALLISERILLSGEELGYLLAVTSVFWVFRESDFFGEDAASDEQGDQKDGADDTPVDDTNSTTHGEQVETAPDALLSKVVRMSAVAPETSCVEALVVRMRHFFEFLAFLHELVPCAVESPLLFISDSFVDDEAEHEDSGDSIDQSEGSVDVHQDQRREGDDQHDDVLVAADEEEIEEHPLPMRLELLLVTENRPTVIFFSLPELELVSTFPSKVKAQTSTPESDDGSHDDQPCLQTTLHSDCPGVDGRQDTPEFVHLAVVRCSLTNNEAEENAATTDEANGLQSINLSFIQSRSNKDIQERTRDNCNTKNCTNEFHVHS